MSDNEQHSPPLSEADLQFMRSERSILERVREHGGMPNRERADWILRLLDHVAWLDMALENMAKTATHHHNKQFEAEQEVMRLRAENAAMRAVVQAVAAMPTDGIDPTAPYHVTVTKARTLLAQQAE